MTNEPTTGELIHQMKNVHRGTGGYDLVRLCNEGALRLESQEREIEELKSDAIVNALDNAERIAELTDRAESAEARERAEIADIKENGFCGSCKGCNAPYVGQEKITFCYGWEWRGQPQDGEGK